MRLLIAIIFLMTATTLPAQVDEKAQRRGIAAAHGSYETLAYSMVIWGVGIGVTAALLSVFLSDSSSSGSSSSHSH